MNPALIETFRGHAEKLFAFLSTDYGFAAPQMKKVVTGPILGTADNIRPLPRDQHIQRHKDAGDFSRWGRRRRN